MHLPVLQRPEPRPETHNLGTGGDRNPAPTGSTGAVNGEATDPTYWLPMTKNTTPPLLTRTPCTVGPWRCDKYRAARWTANPSMLSASQATMSTDPFSCSRPRSGISDDPATSTTCSSRSSLLHKPHYRAVETRRGLTFLENYAAHRKEEEKPYFANDQFNAHTAQSGQHRHLHRGRPGPRTKRSKATFATCCLMKVPSGLYPKRLKDLGCVSHGSLHSNQAACSTVDQIEF